LHHSLEHAAHGRYAEAHAVARGFYIERTEVVLGTKNNMEIEYGRIDLRRFWAPSMILT
jgi:hypothetical protein